MALALLVLPPGRVPKFVIDPFACQRVALVKSVDVPETPATWPELLMAVAELYPPEGSEGVRSVIT